MFGTVELLLDKRHTITVNTGQATCLLRIAEKEKITNKDLADYLGGIDPTLMRNIMAPLLESTVVSEVNSYYTIEESSQIESKHLSKAMLQVTQYLDLIRQQQLQINDPSEKSD